MWYHGETQTLTKRISIVNTDHSPNEVAVRCPWRAGSDALSPLLQMLMKKKDKKNNKKKNNEKKDNKNSKETNKNVRIR